MITDEWLISVNGFVKNGNELSRNYSFRGSKIAFKEIKMFKNTDGDYVVLSTGQFQIANIKTKQEFENIIKALQLS